MAAQHSLQQQGVLGQYNLDAAAAGLGLDELTQSLMQQSAGEIFDESSTMLKQLAGASGPDAAATAALALALSGGAGGEAGGFLRTSTRPTLNRQAQSARLYEQSP